MNPYATDKVLRHPLAVAKLLAHESHDTAGPIQVHLMPTNRCNQGCKFCSYRLQGWKNSQDFNPGAEIPRQLLAELVEDFGRMGVRAVEITGGGEPLLHPDIADLFDWLGDADIDTALVTNGTLLTPTLADLFARTRWKWARVSIDAGNRDDYCAHRHCPDVHWDGAWMAVKMLCYRRQNPEQKVGVGFVVNPVNYTGILRACEMAAESGADNIRVSLAFTPAAARLLSDHQHEEVARQLNAARSLNREDFQVVDLFSERLANCIAGGQDYDYCPVKDFLCVIEGSGQVYPCCTLTGAGGRSYGSIQDLRFSKLWTEHSETRRALDPRKSCRTMCLYASRNRLMNQLREPVIHRNFL